MSSFCAEGVHMYIKSALETELCLVQDNMAGSSLWYWYFLRADSQK